MGSNGKVVVAMSGGVDSSTAAMLLKDEGFDVVGLYIRLNGRHGPGDGQGAAEVCKALGIPHVRRDAAVRFEREVVGPFVDEYLAGRTPAPCVRCNQRMKFPQLLGVADELGAGLISTGHYARLRRDSKGRSGLFRALDHDKDQSYFLFSVGEAALERLVLPLGDLKKEEVRGLAANRGLAVSRKPESQEICFVPDDDYVAFVEGIAGKRLGGTGTFVDSKGREIGRHQGIHGYTIGQRKGLGLGGGAPRRYVTRIDSARNEVVLGGVEELLRKSCIVRDVRRLVHGGSAWPDEGKTAKADVKIRSRHEPAVATLTGLGGGMAGVEFEEAQSAIAPGQAAVFYDGDLVLGGGWIE